MVRFTGLLLGIAALLAVSGAQAAQWRLAKDEAGIQVYLQQIPGSSFQAFRGVTRIRVDMPRLLALQDDVSAACAWIHACSEQKLLKHEGILDPTAFENPQHIEAIAKARSFESLSTVLPDEELSNEIQEYYNKVI